METITSDDIKARIRENFEHHFKVRDAKRYGITEAILLYNLKFWLNKNKAKGKHQYNGRTWMYNSQKAFAKLFTYLSESQVKRALASLVKQEAILKDNFNKMPYDRTNWYALADESELPIARNNGGAK
jgi:phage gp16-like protein